MQQNNDEVKIGDTTTFNLLELGTIGGIS